MKKNFLSTPLVIATMAFAVVAFLFLIDTAVNPDGSKKMTGNANANHNTNFVACTDEAKICPDGSAVGRTGPNCEFAECPSTTNTNTVTSIDKESADLIDSTNKNLHIYTSYKLGIRFKYLSTPDEKNGVLEKGNKIYLYYYNGNTPSDPEKGQWVEMFKKDPATSLVDTITKTFLSDRSPKDCFAEKITNNNLVGWEYAGIKFPVVENDTDPWWMNAEKCPTTYTASNWIGYFAMNSATPDKYYFFSIGQYAIPGTDSQTPWQNTIEAVNNQTAEWKTYQDTKYHFSIKYPSTWTNKLYTEGYNNQGPYVIAFTPDQPHGPLPFISVKENWSVAEEVSRINSIDEFTKVESSLEKTIGTISGTAITYSTAIGSTPTSFCVQHGKDLYIFNSYPNQTDWNTLIGSLNFSQ